MEGSTRLAIMGFIYFALLVAVTCTVGCHVDRWGDETNNNIANLANQISATQNELSAIHNEMGERP